MKYPLWNLNLLFNFQWPKTQYGGVAQLGEHLPCKQGVMGSIPIISTISKTKVLEDELKREFMLIENRIKRKIEYEKTDREDKDESCIRKKTRDQVFPIKG